jgi:hypothetical protein
MGSFVEAIKVLVGILLFLGLIATMVGLYTTHYVRGDLVFGTTNGSLALMAFAVNVAVLSKFCCGCGSCERK